MNKLPAARSRSEILKRGYSDEEIAHIYELGRFFIENGQLSRASAIMHGLVEIVPDYYPAWLGLAYLQIASKNLDAAAHAARQALRSNPDSIETQLFAASCLLTLGDHSGAGTLLGEVGERIESGNVTDADIVRFFKVQLARYESR